MSAESDAQPQATPLQFDHADHAEPSANQPQCATCNTAITDAYYHDGGAVLCQSCGKSRQQSAVPDRAIRTLWRAATFGGGAAIVGALLYWGVMEFLGLEIGIVAIAIGWLVGVAVARATRGRSSRRHQLVAVGLTYMAVSLAYAPFAIKELKKGAKPAADTAAATASTGATAPAPRADSGGPGVIQQGTPAAPAMADSAGKAAEAPTAGGFALALVVMVGLLAALPVLAALSSMPGGLLSLLIIGFGLRQAWKIAVAGNATVTGPHAMGGPATA